MKKIFQILFLFVLTTSITNSKPAELVQKDVVSRMDAYIVPYVEAKDFSGVVLVAQGDKILFEKAYGFSDPENKKP
ncbi:MAG TPA: hypothetical protein VLH08_17845, partial [Acidobacteriota bacterium]|nr:hypothetical protein [Acidobacteriota bacterium]